MAELPLPGTDALEFGLLEIEEVLAWGFGILFTSPDGQQVHAVMLGQKGCVMADKGSQCRVEIHRRGHFPADRSRRDSCRPTNDTWHSHAAFPGFSLVAPQRSIATPFAFGSAAIIRGENHNRVFINAEALEFVHDHPGAPIHSGERGTVAAVAGIRGERLHHIMRQVHMDVRQVEEKRFVAVGADEGNRLLGEPFDQCGLRRLLLDDRFIPQEGQGRIVLAGHRKPHVVAVGNPVIRVEAVPCGQMLGLVAEVPFSDCTGGVAFFLEQFREQSLVGIQALGIAGKEHSKILLFSKNIESDPAGVASAQ